MSDLPKLYAVPKLRPDNELDIYKKAIFLFSCHKKLSKKSTKILRDKLLTLLAIYLKYGFNKESKNKAAKILGVDKPAINSMNLDLRRHGYLVQDTMNIRINHLNDELKELENYIKSGETETILFVFQITNDA